MEIIQVYNTLLDFPVVIHLFSRTSVLFWAMFTKIWQNQRSFSLPSSTRQLGDNIHHIYFFLFAIVYGKTNDLFVFFFFFFFKKEKIIEYSKTNHSISLALETSLHYQTSKRVQFYEWLKLSNPNTFFFPLRAYAGFSFLTEANTMDKRSLYYSILNSLSVSHSLPWIKGWRRWMDVRKRATPKCISKWGFFIGLCYLQV